MGYGVNTPTSSGCILKAHQARARGQASYLIGWLVVLGKRLRGGITSNTTTPTHVASHRNGPGCYP